ncbi:DUF4437 domain-containing protein [Hyphomonas sp. FCG-A18]|uniref:cupin domain-containing protein n=1 Tax=Hyphomonas sp. FCG-A18 TaxID=3080019 RepID=UPI002B29F2F9|nr:DUF4437 domain-containing protein [Hyphomonas sp. FCG-A18]
MLNRPQIEFIHAQLLPWMRIGPGNARPDAEYKFLSRDNDDGACSAVIRYPAGWRREANEHLLVAEEFYVLNGTIEINGVEFGHDTYGYIPAGTTRKTMTARDGAVVLTFFNGDPQLVAGEGSSDEITRVDALHMPWDMTLNDPKLAHLGISRKDLRSDPETGERTFLSMILPHSEPPGLKGPQECHPTVEEAYIVSGSLTGPHGTMAPGAYFWRPPQIPHGPFGTRWGCVALIRFLGGQHVNEWSKEDAPFDFDAPYDPILPENLQAFAYAPWTPPPRY